jgi:hypothetical protein
VRGTIGAGLVGEPETLLIDLTLLSIMHPRRHVEEPPAEAKLLGEEVALAILRRVFGLGEGL